MSETIPRICPHELRPGTTVCLRCRNEARAAARARARRNFLLIGLPCIAVVAVGVWFLLRRPAEGSERETPAAATTDTSAAPAAAAPAGQSPAAVPSVAPGPTPPARSAGPPLTPMIAQGRTTVGDGVFAERSDSVVTVYFDAPSTRTRRAEKFERIVRLTLPVVFGPVADSILALVPAGELARSGDLIADLPSRGVHLPLADGWALSLWPETRAGREGPLVVSYRASVTRTGRE